MKYSQSISAKQYAKAYLLEFKNHLTLDDIENMKAMIRFCRHQHNFMSLVSVTKNKQQVLINDIFQHFSLHKTLRNLVDLLIKNKRLTLFAQILQDICCLYLITKNIVEVTIFTAAPLDEKEEQTFKDLFIKLSNKQIVSNVEIDKTLIAGVRMQSDFLLWEYSIAARIRALSQKLLHKELI